MFIEKNAKILLDILKKTGVYIYIFIVVEGE